MMIGGHKAAGLALDPAGVLHWFGSIDAPVAYVGLTAGAAFGLGLLSVLANGCPFRQHVLAAQGSSSATFYLAGFYGGKLDEFLMRVTEAFQTVPNFLLLLILIAVFGSNLTAVTLAIGVVSWPAPARLTRAEFMTLRNREFVQACRTLGLRDSAIIFREILPNAMPPLIVYASVVMALAILMESALAFLNLSDPNVASWGNLIGMGRGVLRTQWYVSAIPGVAILLVVLAVSLVGQGLNDALNPRVKSR